jgi:hypothetical protein
MSVQPPMGALLRGVRSRLQAVLGKDQKWIDIDPECRPWPVMPYWKVMVGSGSMQAVAGNEQFLHRRAGIQVTITKQLSVVPRDRENYSYFEETQSLERLSEQVVGIVMSRECIGAANVIIDPSVNGMEGFIKPLVYSSATEPTIEDSSWVRTMKEGRQQCYLVQRLRFDGAEIVQKVANLITAATYVAP